MRSGSGHGHECKKWRTRSIALYDIPPAAAVRYRPVRVSDVTDVITHL